MHVGRIIVGTALILAIPAVAMQFTQEVNWGPGDFLVAAALLLATGFAFEWAKMRLRQPSHRLLAGASLLSVLALVWAHLAVGIL